MSNDAVVSSRFPRRDFLKISSVALAGLAGSTIPAMAFGALRRLPTSLLSAGYAAAEPEANAVVWLTPAERLLTGDIGFLSRDAQVTVRSSRAAAPDGKLRGAMIDVVFPALGYQPESYPTYRAWSVREDQYARHASAPVSFRVPIEATSGLRLVFTHMNEDNSAKTDASLPQQPDAMMRLSLGSSSDSPKLRRGIYVVAYGEPAVANWSVVPITRKGKDIVVPDARFSYVVLSIDYAA
jgi:hypothetical protein